MNIQITHVEHTPTDSVRFKLKNSYLGLANSLRRSLLTKIPVCAFDNTWDDVENNRCIIIKDNTSGIHNEFLAHRLCLLPIRLNTTTLLNIHTTFNDVTATRTFEFEHPSKVPLFTLKMQNSLDLHHENSAPQSTLQNNLLDVTSEHFTFTNPDSIPDGVSMEDFFPKNPVSDEYILINVLKSNDRTEGEKIHVVCKPSIGTALQHACYCPVGTVSFHFEKESQQVLEEVFAKKIQYMNQEREQKQLHPVSDVQKTKLKQSFQVLDSERVYKLQDNGAPRVCCFDVESVGNLPAHQLVFDALCMLKTSLGDILRCMQLRTVPVPNSADAFHIQIVQNARKIQIEPTLDHLEGVNILLNNENHTIGNLVSDYMKYLHIIQSPGAADTNRILQYVAYRMKHPLEEKIEIKMKLNPEYNLKLLLPETFHRLQKGLATTTPEHARQTIVLHSDPIKNEMHMCQLLLYKTIMHIMHDITTLEDQWTQQCRQAKILSADERLRSSFSVKDSELFQDPLAYQFIFTPSHITTFN